MQRHDMHKDDTLTQTWTPSLHCLAARPGAEVNHEKLGEGAMVSREQYASSLSILFQASDTCADIRTKPTLSPVGIVQNQRCSLWLLSVHTRGLDHSVLWCGPQGKPKAAIDHFLFPFLPCVFSCDTHTAMDAGALGPCPSPCPSYLPPAK